MCIEAKTGSGKVVSHRQICKKRGPGKARLTRRPGQASWALSSEELEATEKFPGASHFTEIVRGCFLGPVAVPGNMFSPK